MKKADLKEAMDKVYAAGFKNGQIEMRNNVLKLINRDYSVFDLRGVKLGVYYMKKINKIKLTKEITL